MGRVLNTTVAVTHPMAKPEKGQKDKVKQKWSHERTKKQTKESNLQPRFERKGKLAESDGYATEDCDDFFGPFCLEFLVALNFSLLV